MARRQGDPAPVSFATLALGVAGVGVLGLALTAAAAAIPLPPLGRVAVIVVGLILTVVAMGVVSNRLTDRAIRAEYPDEPAGEPTATTGDDDRPSTDGLG